MSNLRELLTEDERQILLEALEALAYDVAWGTQKETEVIVRILGKLKRDI